MWGCVRVINAWMALAAGVALCCAAPARADANRPSRVVSAGLCADQWVLALAGREQVLAVSRLAADPNLSTVAEQAAGMRSHGGTAEEIAALRPDLVITDIYTSQAAMGLLNRLGIRTVRLSPGKRMEEWQTMLQEVGEALGQKERAEKLEKSLMPAWNEIAKNSSSERSPLAAVYHPGGYVPGEISLTNDVLARAGLRNLGREMNIAYSAAVPLEALVYRRPDVLIDDVPQSAPSSLSTLLLQQAALMKLRNATTVIPFPQRNWLCLSPETLRGAASLARSARS